MAEFSFVAPILKGKTDAWRRTIAEIKGPRNASYKESRKKLGITREQVTLQSTPMGDLAVVHIAAPSMQDVMGAMMTSTGEFDTWFREAVLVGVHGFDMKGPPPPAVEVVLDEKL